MEGMIIQTFPEPQDFPSAIKKNDWAKIGRYEDPERLYAYDYLSALNFFRDFGHDRDKTKFKFRNQI